MGAFLRNSVRLILGGVLLLLIYKLIENKQEETRRDLRAPRITPQIKITDHCDQDGGKHCKNTCQTINATKMKPGGEFQFNNDAIDLSNPENQFQAEDCEEGTKLIRRSGRLCTGGDDTLSQEQIGEVECTSDDCCIPKTCGSDRTYSLEDNLNYLIATNNLTEDDRANIISLEELSGANRRIIDNKINRDGFCPYQQTAVNRNTECTGMSDNHTGEDCTIDECCIPKTCANNWDNNDGSVWGMQAECPSQRADSTNTMVKYPGDNPCDTCDINDCCYEQSDFCIVEVGEGHRHVNTNVQSVNFPDTGVLSFPNDINTSVDLTTNYFLSKDDISQTNIQNLLSFGSEDGTDNPSYGIKCLDGFKYGMCSASDDSVGEDTCKTHDNNQRECEAAGCSFTLGDRPRVEYDECNDIDGNNNIKVSSCINTCTADYELSDNGINYFTQTPIAEGGDAGSYRVNPDFYSNKLNTDTDYPYSQGDIPMDCYNHTGIGNSLQYNYTCEGGGSYFSVSQLSNCNTTCSQLHGEGERCGQGNIYDENKADDISSYANFRGTGDGGCCMPVTCDTLSNGEPISCLPHQTRGPDTPESGASRENCCVNKTCSDFINDYNDLPNKLEVVDVNNICLGGRTFNSDRELTSAYLYRVPNDNDAKLTRMDEYRNSSADYDIGCCSSLTCGDWLDNNLDALNIPDNDQKLSEASRMCGPNKFFVENMFAGDMGETITEDSSCCVGESDSTCNPTRDLVSSESGFTILGYTIPRDSDGRATIQFTEKTFNMDTSSGGGEYSIDADDISCSNGFTESDEGIKYKCRINPSSGEGTYYLSGCNSGTSDTGSVETSDKLCNLPSQLENSIQLNGFSFDTDNNVVNFNHFLGNQDQFSCNESTERPIFTGCSEDFTEMTISGCHYQDKPTADGENFYSDRFFRYNEHIHDEDRTTAHPCENLYNMATDNQYNDQGEVIGPAPDDYRNELIGIETNINEIDPPTDGGDIPSDYAINKMKGNVSHFSCNCETDDNECPDHERQVRFKYIFSNDEDYYNDDNSFITNQQAIDAGNAYPLEKILSGGSTTVCELGYYPYRGTKYDYCRPCDNLYKNNHPISAISESFCDSGHIGESNNVTNLLDIQHNIDSMNSNYESNSGDISILKTSRVLGDGTTQTNEDYGPYLGNLRDIEDTNSIDFMTTDNFTLGTRVCDPEDCQSPEIKLYDYSQEPVEDSAFEKAKKWWRTYFNSNFVTDNTIDNSDIVDIMSAPSPETPKSALKSRINRQKTRSELNSDFRTNREGIRELKLRVRNTVENNPDLETLDTLFYIGDHIDNNLINRYIEDYTDEDNNFVYGGDPRLGGRFILNYNSAGVVEGGLDNLDTVNSDIFNKYMNFDTLINDISDLKKEDYLYRDSLKIEDSEGTSQYISTVCNNNTFEVDYIPSFNGSEGECKECANEMPESDAHRIPGGSPPLNISGNRIIRNIDNDNYTPICSYEANMYDESYNEGNIVGFKSKSDNSGEIFIDLRDDPRKGPCEDDFKYENYGHVLYEKYTDTMRRTANIHIPYIKCLPDNNIKITKFCENQPLEDCNKSIFIGKSSSENRRLSQELKEKLETDELNMVNNNKTDGFCGIVNGECKNIYDTENGYLSHTGNDNVGSFYRDWRINEKLDGSNQITVYANQLAMDTLSPHITKYAPSEKYNYSQFIDNEYLLFNGMTDYEGHATHDVDGIKSYTDEVFDISNYGIIKDNSDIQNVGDLTSLSVSNALKEGYDTSVLGSSEAHRSRSSIEKRDRARLIKGITEEELEQRYLNEWNDTSVMLSPTRINPVNTVLNDTMINRCHPILWDGPVDFFYENNSESQPVSTISSSCYLRDYTNEGTPRESWGNYYRNNDKFAILTNGERGDIARRDYDDYSIKSTPLYYDKGRKANGGSITSSAYDEKDLYLNILNPGVGQDGLMYSHRKDPQKGETTGLSIGPNRRYPYMNGNIPIKDDSGFSDAAIFPLMDRVRGCFNDSLIYPVSSRYSLLPRSGSTSRSVPTMARDDVNIFTNRPSVSSLNMNADNVNNEREQCIFHYMDDDRSSQGYCVNACLNHKDCDLVRMTKDKPESGKLRCELLKWNKLPQSISVKKTNLVSDQPLLTTAIDEGTTILTEDESTNPLKSINLGSHLINAKDTYDQSTRGGVVNWLERIKNNPTELNYNLQLNNNDIYRTEFYSNESGSAWSGEEDNMTNWRGSNLFKSFSSSIGDSGTVEIKGRPLWNDTDNDNEIWVSMNKIRVEEPDGEISNILNNINDHEMNGITIQPIDIGGAPWSEQYTWPSTNNINEESTYIMNDGQTSYQEKYNEKTIIDSDGNHKQCPQGSYVQGSDGSYKCSQVINECASCRDIRDYHTNKGDFEGTNDDQKRNFMLSYGCNWDTTAQAWIKVESNKYRTLGGSGVTNEKILDATRSNYKHDDSSAQFKNQHNLIAKTPDGNIIDVEKCMCPGTETVHAYLPDNVLLARCDA